MQQAYVIGEHVDGQHASKDHALRHLSGSWPRQCGTVSEDLANLEDVQLRSQSGTVMPEMLARARRHSRKHKKEALPLSTVSSGNTQSLMVFKKGLD